jgi:ribosomal-protein-alanine N-acetyltransferase
MRRAVLHRARNGTSLPFAIRVEGRLAGQITIDNIVRGALRAGYLGYWIDREVAAGGLVTVMPLLLGG